MFSDPKSNLEQFGIGKGMKVADLGVGAGFYAFSAARLVGDEGRVFCIDVQKNLVSHVKQAAEKEGLNNIEVVWGDMEKIGGTKIKSGSMDRIIASNVLFQLEDKKSFVGEVSRILAPAGKVLVVDWVDAFAGVGPDRSHIINKQEALELFKNEGFEIEKEINAGNHHYGFVAKKV